ncbi:Endo-type membrane-bound lytic murein transglycosylase A [Burkholderiales bacterium]|nr:Endo-type membrane-bound lytic murein transglycosylase A [Burkholderiales bacterium]
MIASTFSVRRHRRSLARLARAWSLAALLAASPSVRADLWAYVDEQGKAHFATEQVDARYALFFKGRSSLDPVPVPPPEPSPVDAVRDHPAWKRVDGPNVARYAALVARNARANGLDPLLVKAVIAVESGYEPSAVSGKGAVGLMQVMPDTGARYGVAGDAKRSVTDKLKEPAINVRVGARYLKDLIARFAGDVRLALAAYNAGEGTVDRYGGIPPFPETQEYVRIVGLLHAALQPPAPRTVAAPSATRRVTIVKPGAAR